MFPMLALSFQVCGVAASFIAGQSINHNKAFKKIIFDIKDKQTKTITPKTQAFITDKVTQLKK